MSLSRSDRIEGLLYGSFIADSIALGVHWVYDQGELERSYGPLTGFQAPRADSYHPKKKARPARTSWAGPRAWRRCLRPWRGNRSRRWWRPHARRPP
jgi:hypothetical protein